MEITDEICESIKTRVNETNDAHNECTSIVDDDDDDGSSI